MKKSKVCWYKLLQHSHSYSSFLFLSSRRRRRRKKKKTMSGKMFQWSHQVDEIEVASNISPRFLAIQLFETDPEFLRKVARYIIKGIAFTKKLFGRGKEYFEKYNPAIHITNDESDPNLPLGTCIMILQNVTNVLSQKVISLVIDEGVRSNWFKLGMIDYIYGYDNENYEQFYGEKHSVLRILTSTSNKRSHMLVELPAMRLMNLNLITHYSLKLHKFEKGEEEEEEEAEGCCKEEVVGVEEVEGEVKEDALEAMLNNIIEQLKKCIE